MAAVPSRDPHAAVALVAGSPGDLAARGPRLLGRREAPGDAPAHAPTQVVQGEVLVAARQGEAPGPASPPVVGAPQPGDDLPATVADDRSVAPRVVHEHVAAGGAPLATAVAPAPAALPRHHVEHGRD